jgi:SsrA-binding protein
MKITTNRKAYYEYSVLEDFDAGLMLLGSEVKSVREGSVSIVDCFAYINNGEVWLKNMKVARYKQTHVAEKHDENRDKKLLLNRKEINRIEKLLQDKGTTMVPLEIFTSNNRIKVKIGIVKGKKLWNKKDNIKERDIKREISRENNFNIK